MKIKCQEFEEKKYIYTNIYCGCQTQPSFDKKVTLNSLGTVSKNLSHFNLKNCGVITQIASVTKLFTSLTI